MALDKRSLERLDGLNSKLRRLAIAASESPPSPFVITEGLRTIERQRALYRAGASKTMKSKHLTGRAFDFAATVAGQVRWDWPLYARLGAHFKATAQRLGIRIVWGGDWRTFKDGPHIELAEAEL